MRVMLLSCPPTISDHFGASHPTMSERETRRALLCSEPCTVTINQGGTHITWTARPALFLPLAHRRSLELPSCAYDFKPHARY
ncbi:hypothetical protein FNV62_28110 [Streptomyces sp. RLB3-17]|nr:hypothetical protein FNV62_28110 [Streptomyces sp. RLB3-17]